MSNKVLKRSTGPNVNCLAPKRKNEIIKINEIKEINEINKINQWNGDGPFSRAARHLDFQDGTDAKKMTSGPPAMSEMLGSKCLVHVRRDNIQQKIKPVPNGLRKKLKLCTFPKNAPGSEPDGSYGRKQKLRMTESPRDFKMVYDVTPNHGLQTHMFANRFPKAWVPGGPPIFSERFRKILPKWPIPRLISGMTA